MEPCGTRALAYGSNSRLEASYENGLRIPCRETKLSNGSVRVSDFDDSQVTWGDVQLSELRKLGPTAVEEPSSGNPTQQE